MKRKREEINFLDSNAVENSMRIIFNDSNKTFGFNYSHLTNRFELIKEKEISEAINMMCLIKDTWDLIDFENWYLETYRYAHLHPFFICFINYDLIIDYDLVMRKYHYWLGNKENLFKFNSFTNCISIQYIGRYLDDGHSKIYFTHMHNFIHDNYPIKRYTIYNEFHFPNIKINLMKSVVFERVCDAKFYFF